MEKVVVQRMRVEHLDAFTLAKRYYNILSSVNDLALTSREIEVAAFTAVKGELSGNDTRKEFCERFNSTTATLNNTVSRLKGKHILVKEKGKIKINPRLVINFDLDVVLTIKLLHEDGK